MNQTKFLKSLKERPLRMAFEAQLRRPQIVIRLSPAPPPASDSPMPALVILGFAFWLVYAFMRTIQA